MAELFNILADLKTQVGGAISTSLELDSIAPVIYDAARRHIVPYLSQAQYDALVTAHAGSSMSAAQTALLPFVRKPLALLTMHEYAKVGGIEFGEGGIHRNESDTKKAAFRYQEKTYLEYTLEKGYDALELLVKFLSDNVGTYSAWAATEEADAHRRPLLNYAGDFRRVLQVQCDRYTFECLRPIIGGVQAFGVQALLPAAFWTHLVGAHIAGTLTDAEKELRKRIRVAIAHRALDEALMQHWVHSKQGRIMVVEEIGEQNHYNRPAPSQASAGVAHLAQQMWADRHTMYWKQYIRDNAEAFALVFDEASGGTNTDADAWHINTDEEASDAEVAESIRKQAAAVWL
jgi:hypothetical protein